VSAYGIDATGHALDLHPGSLLQQWLAMPDWAASRAFLERHRPDLLTPATVTRVQAMVPADPAEPRLAAHVAAHVATHVATHAALLGLAQHDRAGLGYDYLTATDPATRRTVLTQAFSHAEPPDLGYLAQLSTAHAATAPDLIDAAVLRAVDAALHGDIRKALAELADMRAQPELYHHLDGAARVRWIIAVVPLARRLSRHETALIRVAHDLPTCLA
jgi:hypothetical protein